MSDVKKKILERWGFRVYVRKVVSTVRELLQEEDVENIRPTLESLDQPWETAETDRNSQPRNRGISGSGCNWKRNISPLWIRTSLQETISLIFHGYRLPRNPKIQPSITQQEAPIGAKTSTKAKRPKLTLPKFAGDPTEWTTFRDSFSSAIQFKRGTQRNRQISVFEILVSGNCSWNYFGFAFERVELQLCGRSSHEAVWKQTSNYFKTHWNVDAVAKTE